MQRFSEAHMRTLETRIRWRGIRSQVADERKKRICGESENPRIELNDASVKSAALSLSSALALAVWSASDRAPCENHRPVANALNQEPEETGLRSVLLVSSSRNDSASQ